VPLHWAIGADLEFELLADEDGEDCSSVWLMDWSRCVTPCATAGEVNATKATVNGINLIASQRPFSGKVRSIRRRGCGFAFFYMSSLERDGSLNSTGTARGPIYELANQVVSVDREPSKS
jgi:hypothetical protein